VLPKLAGGLTAHNVYPGAVADDGDFYEFITRRRSRDDVRAA